MVLGISQALGYSVYSLTAEASWERGDLLGELV